MLIPTGLRFKKSKQQATETVFILTVLSALALIVGVAGLIIVFGWNKVVGSGVFSNTEHENVVAPAQRTYTTTFPLTEFPMREFGEPFTGGNWIEGLSDALIGHDARTDGTMVYGTDCTGGPCGNNPYHDTIAILGNTWRPDQYGEGTVYSTNTSADCNKEIEILLRGTFGPGTNHSYEANANTGPNPYLSIVKIGCTKHCPSGFWIMNQGSTASPPANGSTFYVSITGNGAGKVVITIKENGRTVLTAVDDGSHGAPYYTGAPGLGFYHENLSATCNSNEFGFTSYRAGEF